MELDITRHPCFFEGAKGRFGRVHLPVAPACNIQCNFCNRKYDCLNESRPGVTSKVLSPGQALYYLRRVMQKDPRISVAGIAGPGDPFATPKQTLETCRLVRKHFPEMLLCVASNGLNVESSIDALAEIGISHLTLTINGVDPDITRAIYSWVRWNKRVYRGRDAAALLLDNQRAALSAAKARGIVVKVNTIIIPGYNEGHVVEVAREVSKLGADMLNCMPICPVEGTPFEDVVSPSCARLERLRAEAGVHIRQMMHCTRCRADAVGLLGEDDTETIETVLADAAAQPIRPQEHRPYVAVASQEGVLVNRHLGEADRLLIFERSGEGFEFVEARPAPPAGGGDQRWRDLAETLSDCRAVLAAGAGDRPTTVLAAEGLKVLLAEGLVEELLAGVYEGRPVRSPVRRQGCQSGAGCSGDGSGCG